MKTIVLGPPPVELAELIAHRRATGTDLHDEVWEGEYHMAPAAHFSHGRIDQLLAVLLEPFVQRAGMLMSGAFNLGEPDDFRVPDRGVHRVALDRVWLPTAAIVVEIVSPDDESWAKLAFFAAHDVGEVIIVDPVEHSVSWLKLDAGRYRSTESSMLGITAAELAEQIDWPPAPG